MDHSAREFRKLAIKATQAMKFYMDAVAEIYLYNPELFVSRNVGNIIGIAFAPDPWPNPNWSVEENIKSYLAEAKKTCKSLDEYIDQTLADYWYDDTEGMDKYNAQSREEHYNSLPEMIQSVYKELNEIKELYS